MGSLKQLPHCRKCWSYICSVFYFSDITPSLLMSMNRRISEARHLSFVQNPSRDDLPLCHKLSRNLLNLFCTVSFDIQEFSQELFGNHWHRFTNQYLSTHHGSCIRYAPMFSGYNRKLVVFRSLYWKSSQLFSPSQTPVWPLPTHQGRRFPVQESSWAVWFIHCPHATDHKAQKRVRAQRSGCLPQGFGG